MSQTSSSTSKQGQSAAKRLLHELQAYNAEPNPALDRLGPVNDDDLFKWEAVMIGLEGTAYEGGRWLLSLQVPPTYPLNPPTVTFVTRISHPNVHFRTGEICLDLLKTEWSPAYTLSATLSSVQQLLNSAEPESPLNVDLAVLMRNGDLIGAEACVRYWTHKERYNGS